MRARPSPLWMLTAGLLLAACGAGTAATPVKAPPTPTVLFQVRVPNPTISDSFDEIVQIFEFAPGSWTAMHSHGGPGLVTVVSGVVTERIGTSEKVFKTGQSWTDGAGTAHQVGNTTGSPALTVATLLISKGAAVTTPVTGTPAPSLLAVNKYQAKLEQPVVPGAFDLVRTGFEFAPGAWTPLQKHSGPALMIVVDGEVTVREQGAEKVYTAGQTWVEQAGNAYQTGNRSQSATRVVSNDLVPEGSPPATAVNS
jgi:quercetin dioxygenase-like cupin family protein